MVLLYFNSIKVRLELIILLLFCHALNNFNSIKVRLEHIKAIGIGDLSAFQFHKGAIRTMICSVIIPTLCYFNSIKVRLEQQKYLQPQQYDIFQFHKGAIRTRTLLSFRFFTEISIP